MAKTPKYMELVNWVKEKINQNELKPGDRLYSEHEFSSMFNMSRQTVRQGISVLERDNIIERRQGSGTYVKDIYASDRQKTMNIAVVTTYVDSYIFPNIIKGIEDVTSKAGYNAQISFTYNSHVKESEVLKNILEKNNIDGLIIETTKSALPNPNLEYYHEILKRKLPILFLNCYYPGLNIPHVSMNDREVGLMAANYLIECGHEKIAGIFKSDDYQGHLRYAGYRKGMADHGLQVMDEHILWLDTEDQRHMADNVDRILRRLQNCTACLCYNDEVAFEIVNICLKNGIRIPEDLSIISVDNSHLANLCEVPLTSIGYPFLEIGKAIAENLLKMIDDPSFNGMKEFTPSITVRESVKKIVRT
ncbi:MAG: substrate-binding domain-containing protein [Clostridiaceae bacterium]|nr:substrate-binding domain-containing protein [Clostridiaceae bacterium]